MANKREILIEALEPVAEQHGLDLVDVDVAGTNKNPILRVYLDTAQGGINLDQLAQAQEWVDAVVEKLDPFMCSYMLEVSSPGIDRPLRRLSDFEAYEGEDVVIYLKAGEARTKVEGVLAGVDGTEVLVTKGDGAERVEHARIKKANIIGKIDFNARNFDALEADEASDDGKE